MPCVQDTQALLNTFEEMWGRRVPEADRPLQVGADVGGLVHEAFVSQPLFDEMEKPRQLSQTLDKINRRFGVKTAFFAAMHGFRHDMDDKIAFGRIPPVGA